MGKHKLKSDKMVEAGTGEETRIGFLLDIIPNKRGWTLDKARKVVELLRQGKSPMDVAKTLETSLTGLKVFLSELRKAAEKGYTLEQYFKKGRPCSVANLRVM